MTSGACSRRLMARMKRLTESGVRPIRTAFRVDGVFVSLPASRRSCEKGVLKKHLPEGVNLVSRDQVRCLNAVIPPLLRSVYCLFLFRIDERIRYHDNPSAVVANVRPDGTVGAGDDQRLSRRR